jgi:hypothetical protein
VSDEVVAMSETIHETKQPVDVHQTERELREALIKARRVVWEMSADGNETPRLRALGNVVIAAIVGIDALDELDSARP